MVCDCTLFRRIFMSAFHGFCPHSSTENIKAHSGYCFSFKLIRFNSKDVLSEHAENLEEHDSQAEKNNSFSLLHCVYLGYTVATLAFHLCFPWVKLPRLKCVFLTGLSRITKRNPNLQKPQRSGTFLAPFSSLKAWSPCSFPLASLITICLGKAW